MLFLAAGSINRPCASTISGPYTTKSPKYKIPNICNIVTKIIACLLFLFFKKWLKVFLAIFCRLLAATRNCLNTRQIDAYCSILLVLNTEGNFAFVKSQKSPSVSSAEKIKTQMTSDSIQDCFIACLYIRANRLARPVRLSLVKLVLSRYWIHCCCL